MIQSYKLLLEDIKNYKIELKMFKETTFQVIENFENTLERIEEEVFNFKIDTTLKNK